MTQPQANQFSPINSPSTSKPIDLKTDIHKVLINSLKANGLGYDPKDVAFNSPIEITPFPVRLSRFLESFHNLLVAKNKAYGNSALEPLNTFSKASSSEVISQQIDHKLSRIKNSDKPNKNDVIDLMGYLTLYCIDQGWLDLDDLVN